MRAAAPTLAAVAWVGWAFALAAGWTLRRRMERVADAEHELRGAATAIGLLAGTDPGLRLQVDRMTAALADLAELRGAEPPAAADLDAGRLAQVLANVIANAAEHGVGSVEVHASRRSDQVTLELRNRDRPTAGGPGRGRGVVIAKRAAKELGGSIRVERDGAFTRTVVELPAPEVGESDREFEESPGGRRGPAGPPEAERGPAAPSDAAEPPEGGRRAA